MVVTRNTDTRLDSLEKDVGDLEKKMETLTALVDELNVKCATTNESVSTLASKLETLMEEMRTSHSTKIPKNTNGPILTDSSNGSNNTATGGTPPMTIPTFDGSDAIAWFARAEQYFLMSRIPPKNDAIACLDMIVLVGLALPWIQLLMRRIPNLFWDRFQQEMMKRFGDNIALDGYEAFAATCHDGSLLEFLAVFKACLAQILDLSNHQYMGFFLAALLPDIHMHMKAANITSYSDAVQLALTHRPPRWITASDIQPSQFSAQSHVTSVQTTSKSFSPSPLRRFRNMSLEKFKKHMAVDTYFKYGLKFNPSHRFPPKTINVLVMDDEESVFEEVLLAETVIQVSDLSCNYRSFPHTASIPLTH